MTMIRIAAAFTTALALLTAAPSFAVAQNSLVGTWHGTYTFPASAPGGAANMSVDDKLVLTPDGHFTETEIAKDGNNDVVSGRYTVMPGNVLHLTPEASQPKSDQPLPPEDYHYQFSGPNQLSVRYDQAGSDGRPLTIQETMQRVP